MSTFDIRKWNKLQESTDRPQRMTEQEKKTTLEAVAKFNEYTQHVYKTNELKEMIENIRTLAENASKMAIEETADWFDVVSVKRDTKSIGESVKIFEGTAKEIGTLQQRLESVFEDIGGKLGKYYEIKELNEDNLDAVGKEDGDIDNDGDEDSSDEYLAKKRAAVSNAVKNESAAQEKYQKFFQMVLAKFGVKSPADLNDAKKKEFFNYIDKHHKGKNESKFSNKFQTKVNEGLAITEGGMDPFVVVDSKGNVKNRATKMQVDKHLKGKKGLFGIPATNTAMAKAKALGNKLSGNALADAMFDLRFENANSSKKVIKEGFATWEMSFAAMNLSGVELRPEKKYKVSARTTIEAIKKASKMAGLKGNDWMATQTNTLKKL